jgi:hypothetical protein
MSVPMIKYRNNDLAAHAVYRYIRGGQPAGGRLTLRPFNRFDPQFTEWWLIPSSEWPAYRYGKLFFLQSEVVTDWMFTGLYVEKGLGQQLSGLVKDNHRMGANWFWHEFLNAMLDGSLDTSMRAVQEHVGVPLRVYLNLYASNHVPDPDTGIDKPDDQLEFVVGEADLRFTTAHEGQDELAPLNGAQNLQDLAKHFMGLQNMSWYWGNWMIGTYVRYSTDDTGDWNAADLWHKLLEPWLPWVK